MLYMQVKIAKQSTNQFQDTLISSYSTNSQLAIPKGRNTYFTSGPFKTPVRLRRKKMLCEIKGVKRKKKIEHT